MDWTQLPNNLKQFVLLTANSRQAAVLRDQYNQHRAAQGELVWPSLPVMPLSTWLREAWYQLTDSRRLLTVPQLQFLWQEYLKDHDQQQVFHLANDALKALALCERWNLSWQSDAWQNTPETRWLFEHGRGFVDHLAAQGWVAEFQLPGVLYSTSWLPAVKQVQLYGFYEIDPAQQRLFDQLTKQAVVVERLSQPDAFSPQKITHYQNAEQELRGAMAWAREQANATNQSVAIVVPDLQLQIARVQRIANEVLAPNQNRSLNRQVPEAYNISLGQPLANEPMIAVALAALSLLVQSPEFSQLSVVLRSPYLAGQSNETDGRAQLDMALRGYHTEGMGWRLLYRLFRLCKADQLCPHFIEAMNNARELLKQQESFQSHQGWANVFQQVLAIFAWPTTPGLEWRRSLNSVEAQLDGAWQSLLAQFAQRDVIHQRVNAKQALAGLVRLAGESVFQPKSSAAPVQILGVLEAWGLPFDQVWVTGMNDTVWPPNPRPTPFIPYSIQVQFGLPHARADRELAYAKAALAGLAVKTNTQLHCSYAHQQGDQELRPSPLLPAMAVAEGEQANSYGEQWLAKVTLQQVADEPGTPLQEGSVVRGGATALQHQALCPFRGYVKSRFKLGSIEEADTGLDALERGKLVHRVLELLAAPISQASQQGNPVGEERIEQAVVSALESTQTFRPDVLSDKTRHIETQRLISLVEQWLEQEYKRPPFSISATETELVAVLAGLTFKLRADRIDTLQDGSEVIVDYKTGKPSVNGWVGERPKAPQLPLYALIKNPAPAALLFAQVKAGDCKWVGVCDDDSFDQLKVGKTQSKAGNAELKAFQSWLALVENWQQRIELLATEIAQGVAAVAPIDAPNACGTCDLHASCRIAQRVNVAGVTDAD